MYAAVAPFPDLVGMPVSTQAFSDTDQNMALQINSCRITEEEEINSNQKEHRGCLIEKGMSLKGWGLNSQQKFDKRRESSTILVLTKFEYFNVLRNQAKPLCVMRTTPLRCKQPLTFAKCCRPHGDQKMKLTKWAREVRCPGGLCTSPR